MVTCVLAIAVEGRYPSRSELTALLMLTFGVMLAVWQVRRHAMVKRTAAAALLAAVVRLAVAALLACSGVAGYCTCCCTFCCVADMSP